MIKDEYRYNYGTITVENYPVGDYTWLTGRWSCGEVTAEFDVVYDTYTGVLSLDLNSIYLSLIDQDGGEIRSYEGDQVDLSNKIMREIEDEAKEIWYRRQ